MAPQGAMGCITSSDARRGRPSSLGLSPATGQG